MIDDSLEGVDRTVAIVRDVREFSHANESRAERVVKRISSGGPMASCVGYGYLIGRDDATFEKAKAAVTGFFERTLTETEDDA